MVRPSALAVMRFTEIKFRRLLDRKIGRLGPMQNLINEIASSSIQVRKIGAVGNQGTRVGNLPLGTDCGESCANRRPLLVLHAFRFIGLSFLVLVERMSALPPKADIAEHDWHVRFVPKAEIPA